MAVNMHASPILLELIDGLHRPGIGCDLSRERVGPDSVPQAAIPRGRNGSDRSCRDAVLLRVPA
jgi:hypothetical protein